MKVGRVSRFCFISTVAGNRAPLPHARRDGDAFVELMDVLFRMGYELGDLILNPPPSEVGRAPMAGTMLDFHPRDVVVLTTRPPLRDQDRDHRPIPRSSTDLECRIIDDVVAQFFFRTALDCVILSPEMAGSLRDEYLRQRSHVENWVNQGGRHVRSAYRRHGLAYGGHLTDVTQPATRTMAYLIVLKSQAWPGGPGLIVSFSMGGTQTLVWNSWLRRKPELRSLITDPGSRFVIADINQHRDIEPDWTSLRPADAWEARCEAVPLRPSAAGLWGPDPDLEHSIFEVPPVGHPF